MGSIGSILNNVDPIRFRSDLKCIGTYQRDTTINKNIYLPDIIGKGYKMFWNFKGRYRVVKGSRASKKSKTTAIYFIYNLLKYENANLLVFRKTYRTLKDSCFSDLEWATHRLGVHHLFAFRNNPLEIEYKPTGQKILFRGLDDVLKVTSISVPKGCLCWVWLKISGHTLINFSNCWNPLT